MSSKKYLSIIVEFVRFRTEMHACSGRELPIALLQSQYGRKSVGHEENRGKRLDCQRKVIYITDDKSNPMKP